MKFFEIGNIRSKWIIHLDYKMIDEFPIVSPRELKRKIDTVQFSVIGGNRYGNDELWTNNTVHFRSEDIDTIESEQYNFQYDPQDNLSFENYHSDINRYDNNLKHYTFYTKDYIKDKRGYDRYFVCNIIEGFQIHDSTSIDKRIEVAQYGHVRMFETDLKSRSLSFEEHEDKPSFSERAKRGINSG